MSFFDRLRPRWKHSDAKIRQHAVRELTDAVQLQEIAEVDPDAAVREAAFAQLKAPDILLRVALGAGEFNLRAVDRLADPGQLVEVAQQAKAPAVRAAAVARIEDPKVLHRIATLDEDPLVRRCAKAKDAVPAGTREYLKAALGKLEIAQRKVGGVAEFCGSLNDLCGAIVSDGRFQIHGVVAEAGPGEMPEQLPHIDETVVPFAMTRAPARRQFVELLGGKTATEGAPAQPVFYRIKIWRTEENAYTWTMEERHIAMTNDVVAWSVSSRGTEDESANAGEATAAGTVAAATAMGTAEARTESGPGAAPR